MSLARSVRGVVLAALAATPHLGAQSLTDRVGAVKDGTVQMIYAARPDACGDGNDVTALGRLITVYPSMRGHGHSNERCWFGPVRVLITRRDGETTALRTYIGPTHRADAGGIDLGTISAPAAATYFLGQASTLSGRAASSAIMAAAVADSADVWRQMLALARSDDRPRDVRSAALFWMSGVAPAEAAMPLTEIARNGAESKAVREDVVMTLSQLRGGAGVPALIEMTRRDDNARWLRERSIFWLGNAEDERARTALRVLATSDTLARDLRSQAIFALGFLDREGGNGPFLRSLYVRLADQQLKDKVIQGIAQSDDDADQRWLVDRVLDANEPVDLRKQAMFWRGQKSSSPLGELIALYPRLDSRELRDHYVFVLSQRHESAAVDKLIDLARNDADREIRAKATFWLGQSRDPRAEKYLEERISK